MLPIEQARKRMVCALCETDVSKMKRVDLGAFFYTGLCPKCETAKPEVVNKKSDDMKQMGLPLVGNVPRVLTVSPISLTQLVLYSPNLLKDCLIKCEMKATSGNYCVYHIIAPSQTAGREISMYLAGKGKGS